MSILLYKVIKTDAQYNKYCVTLEALLSSKNHKMVADEIELLTLLIEKYDEKHSSFPDSDPVALLKTLMKEHQIKAVGLAKLLNVSEGLVSDILHYKKGMSKDTIRTLSKKFNLAQEAFNRPYRLKGQDGHRSKAINSSQ